MKPEAWKAVNLPEESCGGAILLETIPLITIPLVTTLSVEFP